MIKRNKIAYWACQIGGWVFYALTNLFFASVFGKKLMTWQYQRLAISILMGLAITHLLRTAIKKFDLLPPIQKNKWWIIIGLIIASFFLYSFANSYFVELFSLYDAKTKVSVGKRSVFNLITDGPIIMVWVCIYYLWHYITSASKSQLDKVRLESLVRELELKTIKSHINPHFIFNALNSIRALVDENPERARTAITELSNILRSSMQAEKIETTSLERELNIVKDYLALEQIRFEDRLRIVYEIDEDTLDQHVPPMMLQTLVENAIKHGISKQKEGGTITVVSDFVQNHHELIVKNTGVLESTNSSTGDGFGIASTRNRLKLLYGNKAGFSITQKNEQLVEAKVVLPLSI